MAEALEDGRDMMNAGMNRPKFNTYSGPEVFLDLAVRGQPQNEPSFEAKMKVGLLNRHLPLKKS